MEGCRKKKHMGYGEVKICGSSYNPGWFCGPCMAKEITRLNFIVEDHKLNYCTECLWHHDEDDCLHGIELDGPCACHMKTLAKDATDE